MHNKLITATFTSIIQKELCRSWLHFWSINLHLSDPHDMLVPLSRTQLDWWSICAAAVTVRNVLLINLHSSISCGQFRAGLKTLRLPLRIFSFKDVLPDWFTYFKYTHLHPATILQPLPPSLFFFIFAVLKNSCFYYQLQATCTICQTRP